LPGFGESTEDLSEVEVAQIKVIAIRADQVGTPAEIRLLNGFIKLAVLLGTK